MPRQKSKKPNKTSEFIDEDKSLIVHLPIKVRNDDPNLSKEVKKLRKENEELKDKIEYLIAILSYFFFKVSFTALTIWLWDKPYFSNN